MEDRIFHYKNAQEFLQAAGQMLYARETVNNLILGITERLVADPEAYQNPFFATVADTDGQVLLGAVMTPPHNIVLAGGEHFEEGIPVLVRYLRDHHIHIPGVTGPVQIVESFVNAWWKWVSQPNVGVMRQLVYEIRSVQMPVMPPGEFRAANPADARTIATWLVAFEEEALGELGEVNIERAERLIHDSRVFVWQVKGELGSMAMKTRPIAHSISIGGVYTPPEQRRKGFATALVAKLSDHLLSEGYQFVNLFTDLDYPTSNSIYRKIGYVPVGEFRMIRFELRDAG